MPNEEELMKALIYDNINVTEENPLKEFFKIIVQLIVYIVLFYFLIFFGSGIIIKTLSIEKQIKLENFITNLSHIKTKEISEGDKDRLSKVRNLILENDVKFPKTSKLDIGIIDHEEMNALCFPNGNIYITDKLYEKLDTDEKLTFVIAHEMGHYKNRDHLMNLRKSISSSAVIVSLCVLGIESNVATLVTETMDLSDYKYSKRVEANADKYAAKRLLSLYGNTNGGIEVINILKDGEYNIEFDMLSTHPSLNKRILYLKKVNKKY
jgi:Zn-dependent protease with chaperone function